MNRRTYIQNTALMLGYVVSASAVSDLLIACQKEVSLNWKPVFLTNTQADLLAEITETICPKTKTPGAKELAVPQFIDKMLKELLTEKDQQAFLKGLEELNEKCEKNYGKPFVACQKSQKEEFLTLLDKESPKFPPNMWGIVLVEKPKPITFFRKIKSMTLMAYFTSEKIGKEVLAYNPIPGQYLGCVAYTGQVLDYE
jgi:hypothetical protein